MNHSEIQPQSKADIATQSDLASTSFFAIEPIDGLRQYLKLGSGSNKSYDTAATNQSSESLTITPIFDKVGKIKTSEAADEHQKLNDWANKSLKEPERSTFKKDMADFEKRAKDSNLPAQEILKTYQQIERLTEATAGKPLTTLERQHLAQDIMHQVARPTDISQGDHGTCGATTVECRTYTLTPSDAARLVADVALTGQYRAADGTVVKIDPAAHEQSKQWPTADGTRSHASEIFQVTAVNLYYAKENQKTGKDIRYEQQEPYNSSDSGERLRDYSKHPAQAVKDGFMDWFGNDVRNPNMVAANLSSISNAITGKHEKDIVLSASGATSGDLTEIVSEAALRAKLKELKAEHKLPVIVSINGDNEPFYTDAGGGKTGSGDSGHVVTITDYDENTGMVCIDNQWTRAADHGKENPIRLHDLYIAMQPSKEAEKLLQEDVQDAHQHGQSDEAKMIDWLRHQVANNDISNATVEKEIGQILCEEKFGHNNQSLGDAEKFRLSNELQKLEEQLPLDAQIRLANMTHSYQLSSDQEYFFKLENLGWKSAVKHLNARGFSKTHPDGTEEDSYRKEQEALEKATSKMTASDRQALLADIEDWVKRAARS